MAKVFKSCAKVAKLRQIWSHCDAIEGLPLKRFSERYEIFFLLLKEVIFQEVSDVERKQTSALLKY